MFLHENNTASDEYDRKGEQYNLIYLFIYSPWRTAEFVSMNNCGAPCGLCSHTTQV